MSLFDGEYIFFCLILEKSQFKHQWMGAETFTTMVLSKVELNVLHGIVNIYAYLCVPTKFGMK